MYIILHLKKAYSFNLVILSQITTSIIYKRLGVIIIMDSFEKNQQSNRHGTIIGSIGESAVDIAMSANASMPPNNEESRFKRLGLFNSGRDSDGVKRYILIRRKEKGQFLPRIN
jgi:hypothetical protein